MLERIYFAKCIARLGTIHLIVLLGMGILACSPAFADNRVDVTAVGGWEDTLTTDVPCEFQIWLENDLILGSMGLGFRVWSPDGITWQWNDHCVIGSGSSFACPQPGTRADDSCVFDMTGLLLTRQDTDGVSPDEFMIGGVSMVCGLQIGPLDHLYSARFTIPYSGDGLYTICIDSTFIPPSGAFVFVDQYGSAFPPNVMWPPGGRCWPVSGRHCFAQWDEGLPTDMDVSHCGSNDVILSASHPTQSVSFELYQLSGGYGTPTVIDNGDGTCEVGYTPVGVDINQEITIKINADCDGCPGSYSLYSLGVNVFNDSPVLDSGFYYNWGATNNLVTKSDISCDDSDTCDNSEFYLVSGPGQIDPVTGIFTWMPGPSDSGDIVVTIGVTDGIDSTQGSFHVGIADEACCPGDANFSGDVNVGDAVTLINYIFNGGPAPTIPNWADVNADCAINVGDVVYLIAYIFRSGPEPVLGCYY